ncbi:hypothetical protein [Gimesia sp.]|uniref:hypothetical protein n=1 Tax=Gimesia sp. TaxID=2024833 RepID=UPI003A8F2F4A
MVFESLSNAANERSNNEYVNWIANNASDFVVEVVEIRRSSLDGDSIVGGRVTTPHGIAIFDFLKSRATRPINGDCMNISINGRQISKCVRCVVHAKNAISKLCREETYWDDISNQ